MKSEYRWLLFILLPFILILVIHFLIPLEFALQSSPVVQESYNSQKIQIEQVAIRSLARLNSEVVSAKLQTYLNFLSVLTRLINEPDPTRYLTMNLSPTTLNNAYVYTQDFP